MRRTVAARVLPLLAAAALCGWLVAGEAGATGGPGSINIVSVPDSGTGGTVGVSSSLALDSSGFPVVSYFDSTEHDLMLLHCNDPNCLGRDESIASPDTFGEVGQYTSLALDSSGFPVVSYYDATNGDLKVLHCDDPNCTGGGDSITSPDTGGYIGRYSSLALDGSGLPVVGYYDFTHGDLKILHCNDPDCAAGGETITSPDTTGDVGWDLSLELGASGFPVVSYHDATNLDLKLLHCNDVNCAGGDESITSPDASGTVGWYTSLALDASGFPVASYHNFTTGGLTILHCNDPNCAGGGESRSSLGTFGISGLFTSITLDASGFPIVSYHEDDRAEVYLLHCNDPNCTGSGDVISSLDAGLDRIGLFDTFVTTDASGFPVVSYYAADDEGETFANYGDLAMLHCNDPNCAGSGDSITYPDTGVMSGDVGMLTSLALDSYGFPVISYIDRTNNDLKLLHCNDPNCSGDDDTITYLETEGYFGWSSKLVLDESGFPVIAYQAVEGFKLLHCNDTNCAGGDETAASLDSPAYVGPYLSLTLDASGFPVVSYYDINNNELKLLHCNDPNCAGDDEATAAADADTSGVLDSSLALDAFGFPVISYYEHQGLKLVHCNDPNCTGSDEIITILVATTVGFGSSLILDASGFPVVSYYDAANRDLKLLHCNDPNCTGGGENIASVDSNATFGGPIGINTSLALDESDLPVIGYGSFYGIYDPSQDPIYHEDADLNLVHCNDSNCAGGDEVISRPDTFGYVGKHISLTIDASGFPVVSYYDYTNGDLKVLHCGTADCDQDSDLDACSDSAELRTGSDTEFSGGRRNPKSFWDFFDTPTGAGLTRDGSVSGLDIFALLARFNATDAGPGDFDRNSDPLSTPNPYVAGAYRANYHPAFDRGPLVGPDPWNLGPPDGSITGAEIFAVIAQFNHSCLS